MLSKMEVVEIYTLIAQTIADNIHEDEWQKAYMLIERQEGMVKFGAGKYTDSSVYLKPFTVRDRQVSMQVARSLNQLHTITTAGGNNRWNFLWFTLLPSGAYEVDFIWNQDEEDKLSHLSQTEGLRSSARSVDLQSFKLAQAERRSPLVYQLLVREAVKLIPEAWTTAWVSLREAGIGLVEYQAAYQNPEELAEDKLDITYSWPVLLAVEELQRLKTSSGHPDWQQVTFQIAVIGTYRATFISPPAAENAPPTRYASEGHWLTADAAARTT
jgi:hypothetical protein